MTFAIVLRTALTTKWHTIECKTEKVRQERRTDDRRVMGKETANDECRGSKTVLQCSKCRERGKNRRKKRRWRGDVYSVWRSSRRHATRFVDDDPQRPCDRAYARLCNQTSPAGVWWSVGDEGLARAEHQRVFFQLAGWMIGVERIERLYLRADCVCTKARDGQRKASGCVVVCPWYTMRSNVVMISRLPELPPPPSPPTAHYSPPTRHVCVTQNRTRLQWWQERR